MAFWMTLNKFLFFLVLFSHFKAGEITLPLFAKHVCVHPLRRKVFVSLAKAPCWATALPALGNTAVAVSHWQNPTQCASSTEQKPAGKRLWQWHGWAGNTGTNPLWWPHERSGRNRSQAAILGVSRLFSAVPGSRDLQAAWMGVGAGSIWGGLQLLQRP